MTEALNDDNHEDNTDPVNPEISPLDTQENFPENFRKNTSSLPSFNLAQCTSYFTKTFSAISPNKTFNIPSRIPKLASSQTPFKLDPRPIKRLRTSYVK
ncbi:Hypothetical predicted protein [Paramuricea clavata]|uniref:Uncharacterized protein n=1 Tax=Paramuricea clavata TaxID=317549 RepID=A0A6S7JEX7_PARCT|nr:Hypothetical predicted protein [Paramuricea clavata]